MPLDCAELEQRVLMSATPLGGEIAVNAEALGIQDRADVAVELTALSKELHQQQAEGPSFSVAVAAGCTVAMSAGYVMWSMRGSYLVASFLASTPTWKLIDPLPILEFDHANTTLTLPPSQTLWTGEGDRVESMFDNVKATAKNGTGRNNSSNSGQPQGGAE